MAGGATQTAGAYLASDYGVHGGGQKDEAPKLRILLGIVAAAGGGVVQFVSGLTYPIGSTVAIPPSTNGIELSIPTGTTLQGMPGLLGDVLTSSGANLRISGGGTIDANRAAGSTGNCVTLTGCVEPQIEEISLINAYTDGLAMVNCVRPVVDAFASSNGRHGVYHYGTTFGRGQVSVRDNGQRIAGSGLVFDAASTDNTYAPVVATDSRPGGSKTQLYGVLEVAASACDRNSIAAASLGGNATGTVSLVGASSGLQAGAPVGAAGGQLGGSYPNPSIAGPVASSALAGYPWHNADLVAGAAGLNVGVLGGVLAGALPNPSLSLPWSNWTPTLIQNTGVASTVLYAKYVQLDKLVIAYCSVMFNAAGLAGAAILLAGLPSALDALYATYAPIGLGQYFRGGTGTYQLVCDTFSVGSGWAGFWTANSGNRLGLAPSFATANGDTLTALFVYKAA